ncbi:MAG TPA: ATP-binding protein [Candidatus Nanoarchaeia archaeon]|nr:ATP-binding protein [Candidatus Nanoarchaeia archaeon]
MKALDTIDATPGKRIYTSIIADYDLERALCELVDNALDNSKKNKLQTVEVNIELEKGSQTISIKDNSGGVEDLKNLISPGESGNNPQEDIIGMFGVGTKRATVALANIIEIKTRIKGKRTKILKYDEDWVVKDPSWYITPYEAENYEEEISESNTQVNLSNLRKSFDDHYINKIKKYFSQIYAYYLHEGILILKVNEEQIKPHFYDNWTYAPSYNPTKYSGFVQIGLRKVKVEIYSGLSNKSSASDDWGVHIYCNKRLIGKNLKTEEVGFGNGQAGKPHVSISLLNVLVFLSGDAELMPWNSSKSEINYSHELFKKIQSSIKEAVINNAKISRALEGKWNEELFKYSTGEIKEQFVTFDKGLKKNLPPIPPSKKTDEKKIQELNKKLFDSKPWLKGIFGGIETFEILNKKTFFGKNRYLLILLDSLLEISFKEFLVNNETNFYSDIQLLNLFKQRHLVQNEIKRYPKGNKINRSEWNNINHFNRLRNKLIHERVTAEILEEDIIKFYEIIKSVLTKIFGFDFKIQ